jgi:pimeloyl-ACP methyl ester carboxylesterase
MQFAYQFPERCDRVVLVGTGGLGTEVSPLLRALSLPGAGPVLTAVTASPIRRLVGMASEVAMALPDVGLDVVFPALRDLPELVSAYRALAEPAARSAFLHVLRAAVDHRGQVVTMLDRSYLAAAIPVLVVWGTKDPIVPVSHAHRGVAALPGSRLVLVEGAGHFPHREQPVAFVRALGEFIDSTAPSTYDVDRFRAMLRRGAPHPPPAGAMSA